MSGVFIRTVKLTIVSIITATTGGLILWKLLSVMQVDNEWDDSIFFQLLLLLAILVYQYGMTLAYEAYPARRFFPAEKIDRTVIHINTVTYLIMGGILGALTILGFATVEFVFPGY